MDAIALEATNIVHLLLQIFLRLPVLTQWAVTLMLSAGLIIHLFAYNEWTVHDAPSIFTTSGIFFTFVGIAEGLIGFDAQNVGASLPALLSGLQTAFVASVVGVGIALTIKLRYILFGLRKKASQTSTEGATVDDLLNQMVAVQQSLVGADDSTLLSQIKLTRQDTNDRLDSLRKSQSDFMATMAENNSKALIQALQEVIRDFNTKISDQFGENFKHLNDAVGQLLVWQESYRLQLSEMIVQQASSAESMKTATERYGVLVSKAETFSAISNQLATLLKSLDEQRSQIEESLKSLGQLLTTASGSLPQIENKIVQLTEQMTFGVKHHQDEITKAVRDGAVELQGAIGDVKKLMLQTTQTTNQEVNAHVKQLADKTSEQIVKLDAALERELTKAISSLGSQLTALSQRFVDDYRPLTDRLREVVALARKVQQ
jgi:hypothetical protein